MPFNELLGGNEEFSGITANLSGEDIALETSRPVIEEMGNDLTVMLPDHKGMVNAEQQGNDVAVSVKDTGSRRPRIRKLGKGGCRGRAETSEMTASLWPRRHRTREVSAPAKSDHTAAYCS